MNCADFRETLFEPLGLQTRLAQFLHARGCERCRAEAWHAKQIDKAIRALPTYAAPEGLRERLIRIADAPAVHAQTTTVQETGTKVDTEAAPRRRLAWSQVLVVAATLLILSAILYPILNVLRQKQASEAEDAASVRRCMVNLKNLGLGLLIYARDYDDHLPAVEEWPRVIVPYVGQSEESSVFWCSEDTDPTHWPSYAMPPSLSRADLNSLNDWGNLALLYDAEADGSFARRHVARTGARGGIAAYADSHAGFAREAPLGVPGHVPGP